MKRFLSVILSLLMIICLTACEGMDTLPIAKNTDNTNTTQPSATNGISKEDLNGYWESEFDISDIINQTMTRSIGELMFNADIGIDLGLELEITPIDLYIRFENDNMQLLIVKEQYTKVVKDAYISMLDGLKDSGALYGKFLPEGINWEDKIDSIADLIYTTDLTDLTMLFNDYTEDGIFLVPNADSALTYEINDDIITVTTPKNESFEMTLKRGELKLTDDETNIPVFKAQLDITTNSDAVTASVDKEISDLEFEKIAVDVLEAKYGSI